MRRRKWAISRGEVATGGVAISIPLAPGIAEPVALSLYISHQEWMSVMLKGLSSA